MTTIAQKAKAIAHEAATQGGKMPSVPKWEASFSKRLIDLHDTGSLNLRKDNKATILRIANRSYEGDSEIRVRFPSEATLAAAERSGAHHRKVMNMQDKFEGAVGTRHREPSETWEGDLSAARYHPVFT